MITAVLNKFCLFQQGKIAFQIVFRINQFLLLSQCCQAQCLFSVASGFKFQSCIGDHLPFQADQPVILCGSFPALQQENSKFIRRIFESRKISRNGIRTRLLLPQYIIEDHNGICKRLELPHCIRFLFCKITEPVGGHFPQPFQRPAAFAHTALPQNRPPGELLVLFQEMIQCCLLGLSANKFQESVGKMHSAESRCCLSALPIRIHRNQLF